MAERTTHLTPEAAAFVDAQVAAMVGRVGLAQLERLIRTATIRFMPEEAERRRQQAQEGRCFAVRHDSSGQWDGLSEVFGRLDLPDAQALDAAVSAGATALRELGCTDSLDVRRARAVGDLARRQPAIDLLTAEGLGRPDAGAEDGPTGAAEPAGRTPTRGAARACERVVLYLHLSAEALRTGSGGGQVENTRCPVTAGQIRDWCGRPDASVTVKPVIDLNLDEVVDGYPIPGWMREKVALRDQTCIFPFCSRPAHPYQRRRDEEQPDDETGWSHDTDHSVPYALGGPTSTDNEAPLCRLHHNLKTHAGWRYTVVGVRSYLWVSPHGYRYLRTPDGATSELGHPDPPPRRAEGRGTTPLSTSVPGVLDRRPARHRRTRPRQLPPADRVPAGAPPPVAGEPPPF